MKYKPLLFIVAIFFLSLMANGTLLAADKAAIKDIEYLTGNDFVQLHFRIDKMIPIPEVVYPEKNDKTFLVMRLRDIPVELAKERFIFNSNVINYVEVYKEKANDPTVDFRIHLKENSPYRVFTNQKGLFIEFQNSKSAGNVVAKSTPPPSQPTKSTNTPPAESKSKPSLQPEPPQIVTPKPTAKRTPATSPKESTASEPVENNDRTEIKDIVLSEKDDNHIKFEIQMTGQAEFNVIPIPDSPVRLAIDVKNTRSRNIKKQINHLNVKGIRGGLNTAATYRVVFDLNYLKGYKVSPGKDSIQVEFFSTEINKSNDTATAEPTASQAQTSPTPVPNETVNETPKQTTPSPSTHSVKSEPKAEEQNKKVDTPKTTSPAPIQIKNEDFFSDEKAQVKKEKKAEPTLVKASESSPELKNDRIKMELAAPEDDELGQMNYLKRTIDEGQKVYSGERMCFNFHNTDLKDVIKVIAKMAGKNIVLDPGVTGRVTSQLNEVPWDQALDLFLKTNGLDYVEEGNILRIGRVDQLSKEAEDRRKLKEARQNEGELSVITRTLSYAKVVDIAGLLKKQLSARGDIQNDVRSNTLIITEVPSRIETLDKLIDTLDSPPLQVNIEARFVETRTNFSQNLGIQWGYNFTADAAHGNQTTLKFPNSVKIDGSPLPSGYAINLPAGAATSSTVFSFGNIAKTFNLDLALSAMQSKGQVRVISAPKTTTQNNKESYITQGREIPFQTVQNNTVSIQYKAAALELKVTPQITAKETIICTLEINNNSADFANEIKNVGVPIITQGVKTTVMVDNGGTIVIGGIYQVANSYQTNSVPFLSKIPLLGTLFKSSTAKNEQTELLIFITPRIMK